MVNTFQQVKSGAIILVDVNRAERHDRAVLQPVEGESDALGSWYRDERNDDRAEFHRESDVNDAGLEQAVVLFEVAYVTELGIVWGEEESDTCIAAAVALEQVFPIVIDCVEQDLIPKLWRILSAKAALEHADVLLGVPIDAVDRGVMFVEEARGLRNVDRCGVHGLLVGAFCGKGHTGVVMRPPGLGERTQDGAATPEVVVLVEAAEVGRHDEDVLADALRAYVFGAQALTVTVRELMSDGEADVFPILPVVVENESPGGVEVGRVGARTDFVS